MGRQPRALEHHGGVDVGDRPAGVRHAPGRGAQQPERVGALVGRVVVGEVLAEVAQGGGAEQGVDDRVRQHVGVGVALEPELGLERDAADHQRPAGDEAVRVVAEARANAAHAGLRSPSRLATSGGRGVVQLEAV